LSLCGYSVEIVKEINVKWLEKDVEKLRELVKGDLRYKEIGIMLNRSETSVAQKLCALNILKTHKWVVKEIELLQKKYYFSSTEKIIKMLPNHTLGSINKKAEQLGLKRNNIQKPKWSVEEIKNLKDLVKSKCSDTKIAKILGRSCLAVKERRQLYCKEYFTWSEAEIEVLKTKYKSTLVKDLLLLLPYKTRDQITKKANSVGIYKPPSLLWSENEVAVLRVEYPYKTIRELVSLFPNKEKRQINKKAKRLKLRKTKETLARCFRTEIDKIPKCPSKRTRWRLGILKRDNYCCQKCDFKDRTGMKLQAHHIKPVRDCNKEEKYDINNGLCLCLNCHIQITGQEYEIALWLINGGANDFFKRR